MERPRTYDKKEPTPNRVLFRRGEAGSVLLIALGTLMVLFTLGAALFQFSRYTTYSSQKILEQDRGIAEMEGPILALRHKLLSTFSQNAAVQLAGLSYDNGQKTISEQQGFYNVTLSVNSSAGDTIYATQARPALAVMEDPYDPFRGALAVTTPLNVDAKASRIGQAQGAYDVLSLSDEATIDFRQIPVSQFSLYSASAGSELILDPRFVPAAGRTYAMGNVIIESGTVQTQYPLATAGNVELVNGSGLEARSTPEDPDPVTMQVASTLDPVWPSLAKSVDHSEILSGRDLPMGMRSAATPQELTAPPWAPSQGGAKNSQRLYGQCSRVVIENLGHFSVTSPYGGVSSSEATRFKDDPYARYSAGPVIVFDYSKVAPDAVRSSYYIDSTNPNAIVVIRNATTLGADLSIVSPLPIVVSGSFNAGVARRTASLISGSRVLAVPTGF